ncbi:YdbH domain-containing protein [Kiloniella sp. EL199]|uniref:intermembrane phospholipid transport protein YdbH family protein n=1 Tax=Kiloniella sp. EL199 TaxID=2107581 RepID=UPI0013C49709|nr:YdbH domain-containing protein [Kiloniella sp. EL199]
MKKWGLRLLWFGAVMLLIGGSAIYYRLSLAQYLLDQVADNLVVPGFFAEVSELSHHEVVVQDIVIGDEREITLDRLVLTYDLIDLWQGGELAVDIDRLFLSLDVTGQGPVLGSLDSLFGSEGQTESQSSLPVLPFRPALKINNSNLQIMTDLGAAQLPFAVEVRGHSEDDLQGWISFEGGHLADYEPEEFYLGAIFSSSDLQIDWDIKWQKVGVSGEGAASFFLDDPGLNWNAFGDITGNIPKAFLPPDIERTRVKVNLDGVGQIDTGEVQLSRWREAINPLMLHLGQATVNLITDLWAEGQLISGARFDGQIPLKLIQKGPETEIGLGEVGQFNLKNWATDETIPPAIKQMFGPSLSGEIDPAETIITFNLNDEQPVTGRIGVTIRGETPVEITSLMQATGRISRGYDQVQLENAALDVRGRALEFAGHKISDGSLAINLLKGASEGWRGDWSVKTEGVDNTQSKEQQDYLLNATQSKAQGGLALDGEKLIFIGGEGQIKLAKFEVPGVIRTQAKEVFSFKDFQSELQLLPDAAENAVELKSVSGDFRAKALKLNLVKENNDIIVSNFSSKLRGREGDKWHIGTTISEIELPDQKLKINAIRNDVTTPFFQLTSDFDVKKLFLDGLFEANIKPEDPELALPVFTFMGKTSGPLEKTDLSADVKLLEGTQLLNLVGNMDLISLDGKIEAAIPQISFSENGIQPKIFTSHLSDLKVSDGSVSGRVELDLNKGVPDGHGYLNVDLSDAEINELPFKNLVGRFFFQGIAELVLPPGQKLEVASFDAGVPISNIELVFGIESKEDDFIVDLRNAGLMIAGGNLGFEPQKIPVLADRKSILLQVEKLDLKELFTLIGREDLSGTGQLTGQIPIKFEGEQIIIEKGALATEGPGVLQIRSQLIADALAAGGEQVELLVKALQNFEYTELTLDIDKPINSPAQVSLGISGANKDVLDGHPFRLNINLETKVEPLLEVLLQGQKLSQGLVSGLLNK